jgi:uncharacterized membrane protein
MPMAKNEIRPEPDNKAVAGVVHRNIRSMLQLRQQAEQRKGIQYRFSNFVTRNMGSLPFACIQTLIILGWFVVNMGWIPGLRQFDSYPFTLLSTVLTIEAIFVAIFILMNQNHMADLEEKREDLNIQISLLTEHEVTQIMALVDKISHHLNVRGSSVDISDLKKETSPEKVLLEIERELGNMEKSP